MGKQLVVGIGDMKLGRQEGTIITYALGSCIGITLYDPMIKLGALVHIMLPERQNLTDNNIFKYADTGLKETFRKLYAYGGSKIRMTAKIAGGAKMFEMKGGSSLGNIGDRNAQMVKHVLTQEGIRIVKQDTGANYARTMSIDLSTGMVTIKSFGRPELHL